MIKRKLGLMQIGRNGLTENFFMNLENEFKNHENVKVIVLKNAGHEKKNMAEMNSKILERLGNKYTSRVIGFTISLKKWRKAIRS